jgi:hypothetical protein
MGIMDASEVSCTHPEEEGLVAEEWGAGDVFQESW